MPYEAQQSNMRNLVISANKQNTAGALADAALTHRLRHDPAAFAQFTKEFFSDIDRAGKGHPWPTVRQEIARNTAFQLATDIYDFLAGWLPMTLFQKVVTSGIGPFTHLFTFEVATNIAAVTSLWAQDSNDLKYKLHDLAATQLSISGAQQGPLQASIQMIGSGRHTDGTLALPALPTPVYLVGSDTDILIGPQAAPVSIKERVRSWEVTFVSGIAPHRAPGGGLFSSFHKIGLHRATARLGVAAKDVDDIRTLFLGDTKRELQINTNSGAAAQLNIKFPAIFFSGWSLSNDGIEIVHQLEASEQDVLKEAGNLVELTAINSQATYLVGAA